MLDNPYVHITLPLELHSSMSPYLQGMPAAVSYAPCTFPQAYIQTLIDHPSKIPSHINPSRHIHINGTPKMEKLVTLIVSIVQGKSLNPKPKHCSVTDLNALRSSVDHPYVFYGVKSPQIQLHSIDKFKDVGHATATVFTGSCACQTLLSWLLIPLTLSHQPL